MLFVIALGGNALLKRGESQEADTLKRNIKFAAKQIAEIAKDHQVVIVHGNGPQVGLLALQSEAYKAVSPYPLDVLDAESQGMVGYLLQQELSNALPSCSVTLLTQVVVDKADPAFLDPSKPIGPVYNQDQVEQLKQAHDWVFKADEQYFRRVVPSPKPEKIVELEVIKQLAEQGVPVVAGNGGGIPCVEQSGQLSGVEAVVDKDLTAALLARELKADRLIILTDVDFVYKNWGTDSREPIKSITADELDTLTFPAGSMQPKVDAAIQFVRASQHNAFIGSLGELVLIVNDQATGTCITPV